MPKTSGAWQLTAVGVALIVGACSLLASSPLPQIVSVLLCGYPAFYMATFGMLLIGFIVLVWAIVALQRIKRRRAWALQILDQLVGLGDVALRTWAGGGDPQGTGINQWRAVVGQLLTTPPFRPGLHGTVLGGQAGTWIREPLQTLREMALRFDDDWLSP